MEIFVSEKFLDDFIKLEDNSFINKDREKLYLYGKINNLIVSGLKINSDISSDKIQSLFNSDGNKKFNDIKDVIALMAIKNTNYNLLNLPLTVIPNYSAFYFIGEPIPAGNNSGTVIIDNLKALNDFYSNCTLNSLNIGEDDYSLIKTAIPPCNAMLIIDKYLFNGSKKLSNFIKYLNLFLNTSLDVPFQLTIISSYENNNKPLPPSAFTKYTDELDNISNLQYQIFLDKNISIDDRKFYTNYTKANWGHPLDRESIYNQNFIATSENIVRDYTDYCKDINKWKNFSLKIPNNIGLTKTKYFNETFENRIFNNTQI